MAGPQPQTRRERIPSHLDRSRGNASASRNISASEALPATAKAAQAKSCCSNPDVQEMDGNPVCINCGTLIKESNIVSEVTFGEASTGAAVVQGASIGEDQRHAKTMGLPYGRAGGGSESREQTERRGRDQIVRLANSLRIVESTQNQAFQCYKLALGCQFTQGRRTTTVAASCLYIACRRDANNTILLMDLAEKIRVNVFKLGSVYKALVNELWLDDITSSGKKPVIEVEPLILKFSRKLEFGQLTNVVAQDAVKILQRMKRDWMVTGRQPAGLCGACIILAARMNNFRRTIREVVYVVRVGDATVNQRLQEFARTSSAGMTVDQFRQNGARIKTQHDPPSVYRAREKADMETRRQRRLQGLENEPAPATSEQPDTDNRRDSDGFLIPSIPSSAPKRKEHSTTEDAAGNNSDDDNEESKRPRKRRRTSGSKKALEPKRKYSKRLPPPPPTADDLAIEDSLETEITDLISDPATLAFAASQHYEAASERARALADVNRGISLVLDAIEISADEFADDPEVANCELTAAEVAVKERIWVTNNEDWLRKQQEKMLRAETNAIPGSAGGGGGAARKKRQKRGRMGDGSVLEEGPPVTSPAEAVQRMLAKRAPKGFSKFLNYERLSAIYNSEEAANASPGSASDTRARASPSAGAGASAAGSSGVSPRDHRTDRSGSEEVVEELDDDDDEPRHGPSPVTWSGSRRTSSGFGAGTRSGPGSGASPDEEVVEDIEDDEDEDEDMDEDEDDEMHAATAAMGIDTGEGGIDIYANGGEENYGYEEYD